MGVNSTYQIVVGRSQTITGPYLDRGGQRLDQGGGTLVLSGYDTVRGPGGESVFHDTNGDWLVHHFYDASDNGLSKVQLRPLVWSPDDWPLAGEPYRGLPPLAQDLTAGTWLQSVAFGPEIGLRFYPDGRINDPNGPDYWTLQGNVLTMHWPNPQAPGGEWVDTCIVSADGRWLAGRNQANAVVRARRAVLPDGWADGDVGSPGIPGYADYDSISGTWTVGGGGSDIGGAGDQFDIASENLAGDGSVVARVTAVQNTDPSAKAGVMLREDTSPGAAFADVVATPGNGVTFQWRAATGAVPSSVNVAGITAPVWVKLTRVGGAVSGFYSGDGNTWTQVGVTQTIPMSTAAQAGLAVTAHNNGLLNASTFTNVSVLPSGWSAADVGGPGLPGSSSYDPDSGAWAVAGGGADIWNASDQFRFTYRSLSGDGEVVARVTAVGKTGPFAKAGVMIRESLAANSRHALVDVTPSQGVEFIRRTATGSNAVSNFDPGVAAPYWVRLLRRGNTFTAFDSPDGATWHLVGGVVIPMGGTVYAGLAVCAFNNDAVNAAAFSDVSVLPHAWSLPPGWGDSDVGGPGQPGYADFNAAAGTWTVGGSGADIAGTSDQFHFVSRSYTGDATLTARVAAVTSTDPWAKAGVMFRASADPGAAFADVMATPGNGVIFQWRDTSGGPTDKFQVPGLRAPVWVRVLRAGDAFSGYYSTDGVNWTQVGGSHTVVMSPAALIGLAVSSHNNGVVNTATFDNLALVAADPAHLQFTNPAAATAGTPFQVTVTVQDAYNNTVTGYTGTVHFTTSAGATADYTFTPADMGAHTFSVTLVHAGALTVTATDTGGTGAAGMTQLTVTPAAASTLVVAGFPSPAGQGQAYAFTVTAYDAYGNVATGYTGTVSFASNDTDAGLPASYTFTAADAGTQTLAAAFNQTGVFSLRATDTADPSIAGEEDGITVV